jgi:hypothetical protein
MDNAEFLTTSGARLNLVDEFGKTPIEYAVGKVHKGGCENSMAMDSDFYTKRRKLVTVML